MRILYHHRTLARDGMHVHIDEIVSALRRQGHTVRVVGPGDDAPGDPAPGEPAAGSSVAEEAGGRIGLTAWLGARRARLPAWLGELLELAYNLKAMVRLRRAARAFGPDVVYERYNLFLLAGVWSRRALGVPLVMEVNAPLCHERATHGTLSLRRVAAWAERTAWRGADAVLPVSDALAAHVRAAGVDPARIAVIRNAVRPEVYEGGRQVNDFRVRLGLGGRTVCGFVGFVRPWHGLERVLQVIAAGRDDLHLLVVGDGPARAALVAEAARLGAADRLTFTGALPHAAIPDYLGVFDIALQPDVTPYASPLKLFEYMAAGCAVVAPDRPNIREIVRDGETALLFDPNAPGALDAALARLCRDGALRRRLGAAARAEVARRGYSWDENARRIVRIAAGLPGGTPAGARDVPPLAAE